MIKGLKLDFTSEQLIDHLRAKAEHHKERSAFYTKQAEALKNRGAEATACSGGDPVNALQGKSRDHGR